MVEDPLGVYWRSKPFLDQVFFGVRIYGGCPDRPLLKP